VPADLYKGSDEDDAQNTYKSYLNHLSQILRQSDGWTMTESDRKHLALVTHTARFENSQNGDTVDLGYVIHNPKEMPQSFSTELSFFPPD
jgi:hypothetical protein